MKTPAYDIANFFHEMISTKIYTMSYHIIIERKSENEQVQKKASFREKNLKRIILDKNCFHTSL